MIDIIPSRDCGNSPKNQFAEQVALALETGDIDFLKETLGQGVRWKTTGRDLVGCEQFLAQLEITQEPSHFQVDHVVTHGKVGAVNDVAESEGPGPVRRFCHVLTFINTKSRTPRRITSFSG